jgi:ubiquitin conjugation factor E4 B
MKLPRSRAEMCRLLTYQIRMKRLAKLGVVAGGNPTQNGEASSSPATNSAATSSPATAPTAPSVSTEANSKATGLSTSEQDSPAQVEMVMDQEAETDKKTAPQIKVHPRPASPAKRDRDGAERPRARTTEKQSESLESWQDRTLRQIFRATLKAEEVKDAHGHPLIFLASTKEDLVDAGSPAQLNVEVLEGAITEAASKAPDGKPFEFLLGCFKRVSRAIRGGKFSGPDDPKHEILRETRRLCMSYCIFAVTMPEMFGDNVPTTNALVDHLLTNPEDDDRSICTDFLTEASNRFEEDDTIKEAVVGAAEVLSEQ